MPRIAITDEYALVKRKGSNNWYLEWREAGEKRRCSTGHHEIEQARARARELILEGATIRDQRPSEMPIRVILDRYMAQVGSKLAGRTSNRRAVKLWIEFWGDDTLDQFTPARQDAFRAWLYARDYSQGYVRRVLATGKTAFNRAWQRQEITAAPFVALPQPGESWPHTATDAQLIKFMASIPDGSHLWPYVLIRLNTGCRGDAACSLKPAQVYLDSNLVRLNPPGRQQTKKYRPVVPLTKTLRAMVKRHKGDGPFVVYAGAEVASIRTAWNAVRRAAGLPAWFTPKAIRHTVATVLRSRGVPGWDVSGQLGHKTGESHRTTEHYAKFAPDYLSKARRTIDAWMAELAAGVPALAKLIGVSAGSVAAKKKTARTRESRAVTHSKVVEPGGIEPPTSTMPL